MPKQPRVGLMLMRVWRYEGAETALVARMTELLDIEDDEERQRTVTSVEQACVEFRAWLERFVTQ